MKRNSLMLLVFDMLPLEPFQFPLLLDPLKLDLDPVPLGPDTLSLNPRPLSLGPDPLSLDLLKNILGLSSTLYLCILLLWIVGVISSQNIWFVWSWSVCLYGWEHQTVENLQNSFLVNKRTTSSMFNWGRAEKLNPIQHVSSLISFSILFWSQFHSDLDRNQRVESPFSVGQERSFYVTIRHHRCQEQLHL